MVCFLAGQVIANITNTTFLQKISRIVGCLAFLLWLSVLEINSQTIIPLAELLERPVNLRPELKGVHPRLFFTAQDLPKLRDKAKGTEQKLWQEVLKEIESFGNAVPDPADEDLYKSGLAERKKRFNDPIFTGLSYFPNKFCLCH